MRRQEFHSATELARMRLPGLPATRENILKRAEMEGWPFKEVPSAGRHGIRRIFEVPEKYLSATPREPAARLFTAAEVAQMAIPGLPTTKASVLARAKNEGWRFEECKGKGGTRWLFEIPAKYFQPSEPRDMRIASPVRLKKAGFVKKDLMTDAVRVLDLVSQEQRAPLTPERRGAILTFAYNSLLQGEGIGEAVALLTAVAGA